MQGLNVVGGEKRFPPTLAGLAEMGLSVAKENSNSFRPKTGSPCLVVIMHANMRNIIWWQKLHPTVILIWKSLWLRWVNLAKTFPRGEKSIPLLRSMTSFFQYVSIMFRGKAGVISSTAMAFIPGNSNYDIWCIIKILSNALNVRQIIMKFKLRGYWN